MPSPSSHTDPFDNNPWCRPPIFLEIFLLVCDPLPCRKSSSSVVGHQAFLSYVQTRPVRRHAAAAADGLANAACTAHNEAPARLRRRSSETSRRRPASGSQYFSNTSNPNISSSNVKCKLQTSWSCEHYQIKNIPFEQQAFSGTKWFPKSIVTFTINQLSQSFTKELVTVWSLTRSIILYSSDCVSLLKTRSSVTVSNYCSLFEGLLLFNRLHNYTCK